MSKSNKTKTFKDYYQDPEFKKRHLAYIKEKIICECGTKISKHNKYRHLKSDKHKRIMNEKELKKKNKENNKAIQKLEEKIDKIYRRIKSKE